MSAAQVARRVGPPAERAGGGADGEAAAHAAPQLRYVVMSDGTQRGAAPAGALASAPGAGAGAGAGAGPTFWTAEDPWRLPKRAAARAAVAACGYQPDPFWPSDGASAPPPSPRAPLAHPRERPPSAAARPLSADEGDARAAGETRARASLERQAAAAAAAAEEAEKPSELPPASRHSRRHRTHSRSDSARDHAHPHPHPHTHAHATHAKRCAQAAECAQQEPARPRRPRSAGAEAHGQHARASPRGLGLSGRVRYRREDTYIVAVPSNPALAAGPRDAGGDADDGRGGGSCDGSPGRGGAGGDSPGDLALRLAHARGGGARASEESLKRRPSTASATCERRRSCECEASAEALPSDALALAHAHAHAARTDSLHGLQAPGCALSASGDAGLGPPPAPSSASGRAPRVGLGLVSVSSWKLHDGLAWELWYEQKLKEEHERRRRDERRRKVLQAQEEARRREEEKKKELEEENRKKWLERKKKQEEEERRRAERQRRMAERREQEEAQRNEQRLRFCAEYMRKASEKKEEMKKAEAAQRALEERLREEAEVRRRELSERSLEQWRHRAARHAKPLTGCIFQRDPQPKAPKAAIDFINPEPWQF